MTTRPRIAAAALALLALLAVEVVGATAAPSSATTGRSTQGFCDPHRQARDFGFSALPPVHELDSSTAGEELGHPHVDLEGGLPGLPEVRSVDRPGEFGYRFSETGSPNPVFVHWTVTETMWAVDSHGGHAVEVGHTGVIVNSINVQHEVSSSASSLPAAGSVGGSGTSAPNRSASAANPPCSDWKAVPGLAPTASPKANRCSCCSAFFQEVRVECGSYHLPADLSPRRYRLLEEAELFRWPRKKPIRVKLKAPFTVATPR